ncbi:GNAT family N-acetyltransferase [Devosia beringensis]|uniref:GNAT family N-acetyltransferase n=1 Tax=Devosia beringensis TaxID=2657486 RepID=UPI00186B9AA8|nr:GNAT family N-acetyltransferase [Devosia beringensis]
MVEIGYEAELQPDSAAAISAALTAFNRSKAPQFPAPRDIGLTLRDPASGVVDGGLTARISLNWMFVELLIVPERPRGQGVGSQIMAKAEDVARQHGCDGIWLDTFSFQAPGFYAKLGYVVFGEIAHYPPGASRFFLHKHLS